MATSRKMRLRRRAREIALQLIYMAGLRPETEPTPALDLFDMEGALSLFAADLAEEGELTPNPEKYPSLKAFDLDLTESERDAVIGYAAELFEGVCSDRTAIEDIIRVNMESSWRPERLTAVDKAVISLAVYEGLVSRKAPVNVAISEAVVLAKTFGSEDSGRFVNGVLGRIARSEDDSES